jgi:hypothetical protein
LCVSMAWLIGARMLMVLLLSKKYSRGVTVAYIWPIFKSLFFYVPPSNR